MIILIEIEGKKKENTRNLRTETSSEKHLQKKKNVANMLTDES